MGPATANKRFVQWRGSVSSLLSVSLFKLCRETGRDWSVLAFAAFIYQTLLFPALHKHKHCAPAKKMQKSILILIMAIAGLFSCKQRITSTPFTCTIKTLDSTKNAQSLKLKENDIHTKHEYTDPAGARLIIQNSFLRSRLNCKDHNAKESRYAVFWTRIINGTTDPLELTIDFPLDSFEIPSSSGNYMKLLLPSGTVTIDKQSLYDYGLKIKSF